MSGLKKGMILGLLVPTQVGRWFCWALAADGVADGDGNVDPPNIVFPPNVVFLPNIVFPPNVVFPPNIVSI